MSRSKTTPKQQRDTRGRYQSHGVNTLKRAVLELGSRGLPTKRTALGRAFHEWRSSLARVSKTLSENGSASKPARRETWTGTST
jgi:hypothetical protein